MHPDTPKMKRGHGSKFERNKEAVITGLLSGKSTADIARTLEVDPCTVKRWVRLPEFQAEFLQERRDGMTQAIARIQHNAALLAGLGLKLAADERTRDSVRAQLVLGLLDRGIQAVDRDDIQVRLAALERDMEEQKNKR